VLMPAGIIPDSGEADKSPHHSVLLLLLLLHLRLPSRDEPEAFHQTD
jgi:hypothetical protein